MIIIFIVSSAMKNFVEAIYIRCSSTHRLTSFFELKCLPTAYQIVLVLSELSKTTYKLDPGIKSIVGNKLYKIEYTMPWLM